MRIVRFLSENRNFTIKVKTQKDFTD